MSINISPVEILAEVWAMQLGFILVIPVVVISLSLLGFGLLWAFHVSMWNITKRQRGISIVQRLAETQWFGGWLTIAIGVFVVLWAVAVVLAVAREASGDAGGIKTTPTPTGVQTPPVATNTPLPNKDVSWQSVLPQPGSSATHALVVQFLVRYTTLPNYTVGINVGSNYTKADKWWGVCGDPNSRVSVGIIMQANVREEPPVFSVRILQPALPPGRCLFLYFESETPFNVERESIVFGE